MFKWRRVLILAFLWSIALLFLRALFSKQNNIYSRETFEYSQLERSVKDSKKPVIYYDFEYNYGENEEEIVTEDTFRYDMITLTREEDRLEEELSHQAVVQSQRKTHLRSVCEANNLVKAEFGTRITNMIVEPMSETMYCFIYKSAASTWMAFYLDYFGSKPLKARVANTGQFQAILRELKGDANTNYQRLNSGDYFSFVVVRNPFDRLLSAFRDRILEPSAGECIQYAPLILKEENIQNKLTHYLGLGLKMSQMYNITEADLPTFPMFLRFLVNHGPRTSNLHWHKYRETCYPCTANYSAIVKLETARLDEQYVLHNSKLGSYTSQVEKKHETRRGNSVDFRAKYFSQVDCSLLKSVYEMYRLDFELFGYDPDDHYRLCVQDL